MGVEIGGLVRDCVFAWAQQDILSNISGYRCVAEGERKAWEGEFLVFPELCWRQQQKEAQSRHAIVHKKKQQEITGLYMQERVKLGATLLGLACMSMSMVLERSPWSEADS